MNWSDPAYVQEVAPLFKEYGVRTILFAGNGVSMMPHAFSHYGFASVALDTSSVATNFSRRHPPSEEALLAYFCPEGQLSRSAHSREKMREAMASAYHPGGTVEFLVQDLFTYHPIEGGFQAVVMQHVAEHFSPADRSVLAARLYRWLSPGGILVVESQHHLSVLFEAADGIEEAFEAAGFLFHLKDAYLWKNEQYAKWRQQPSEVRARTQGDIADGFTERAAGLRSADFAQARRGRRLVIFRGCA